MRASRILGLVAAAVIVLAGCTSPSEPAGPDTAAGSPPPSTGMPTDGGMHPDPSGDVMPGIEGNGLDQSFEFMTMEMAQGTFSISSSVPDDELVQEVETWREKFGTDPLTYVVVEVDNSQGAGPVNMYSMDVVDQDGQQHESIDHVDLISHWQDEGSDADYNKLIDLDNKLSVFLQPGAKGTAVMIFQEEIPSVQRIFVYASGGMESTEAFPS